MSQLTLEERLAALEKRVDELSAVVAKATEKDWRRTVGMFAGNEAMKAIDAAGQAILEKERQRARSRGTKKQRVKK
jgi:hypothetical protein